MLLKIVLLSLFRVFLLYYLGVSFIGALMVLLADSKEIISFDSLGGVGPFLAAYLLIKTKQAEDKEERKLLESFRPRLF
jgi:hypothetical protein